MKETTYDNSQTRYVVRAMIMDDTVCGRLSDLWTREGLFYSDEMNRFGQWSVDFYRKFGESPKHHIKKIFEDWEQTTGYSKEVVQSHESLLSWLSYEQDQAQNSENSEFLMDRVQSYLNQTKLDRCIVELQTLKQTGRIDDAWNKIEESRRLILADDEPTAAADDVEIWEGVYAPETQASLLHYPEAAGKFIQGRFCRGELYAFLAPEKSGKTTFLTDAIYRALRRHWNVAAFDVGDGSQREMLGRLGVRAAKIPNRKHDVRIPKNFVSDVEVVYDDVHFRELIQDYQGFQAVRSTSAHPQAIQAKSYPNNTCKVSTIHDQLSKWKRKMGWIPDVIVIDYADILAPPPGCKDRIEKIDETWKELRQLTQTWNVLGLTATQTKSAAYNRDRKALLGPSDFSGSKTKNAHVSGIIGLNVCKEEKRQQMCRWNWVEDRGGESEETFIIMAGCYDLRNPCIISKWGKTLDKS